MVALPERTRVQTALNSVQTYAQRYPDGVPMSYGSI